MRLDRDYGIVFQSPVPYDWRRVGTNIALPLDHVQEGVRRIVVGSSLALELAIANAWFGMSPGRRLRSRASCASSRCW
jgi:hypothetical protein